MIHTMDNPGADSRTTTAPTFSRTGVPAMGPLRFTPYLRPMVWGGRRLGQLLAKALPTDQPYGESWDVSDHASHTTAVANGPLARTSLRDLMQHRRRELLGAAADRYGVFPWLATP